jgi:hypothetical protein
MSSPSGGCKRRDMAGGPGAAGASGGAGQAGSGTVAGGRGGGNVPVGGRAGGGSGTNGAWAPAPGSSPCVLEVADVAKVAVVPYVWSACGSGCSTTGSKVLDTDDSVPSRLASARVESGEVHVRVSTMWGGHYYMNAVRRLSDGALVAAVRAPGPTAASTSCGWLGFAPSAPHVLGFQNSPDGSAASSGTVVAAFLQAGSLVWGGPVAGVSVLQDSVFENNLGWGAQFDDGTLRVMFPPTSAQMTTIDQGTSYPAHSAVGWGSLIISNPALSGSLDTIIRAWEPDRPSRTIVAQPDTNIPSVALSDAKLVWVGVHGPGRLNGTYTAAEVYWTPFPAGAETVPVMGGTALPGVHGFLELQTWGDYAATTGEPDEAGHSSLFVVRLSDGHVWSVPPRSGASYVRVLTVTPQEILVGEIDDSGAPGLRQEMQYLTRYEIDRLDDIAAHK